MTPAAQETTVGRVRLGIVGIENSHATEIIGHLNATDDGLVVVALVAGEEERTRHLRELGGIELVVDSPDELLGQIDALVVTTRDGARHAEQAVPFLEAGVPVWVDKPFATTVADADRMLAAARAGGTVVTSYSALRWVADTEELMAARDGLGPLQSVTVTGPADPASPYSGLFFYGIHAADVAQRLVPGPATDLDVLRTPGAVLVRYRVGAVAVSLELVRPDDEGQVPFRATLVGSHGVHGRDIVLGPDYVQPGIEVFAALLRTGVDPVPATELLAPISLLEQVRTLLN